MADYSGHGGKSNPEGVSGGGSVARPEERKHTRGANSAEHQGTLDEVWVGHHPNPDEHRFPKTQAFAEDESDKADAAEKQPGKKKLIFSGKSRN